MSNPTTIDSPATNMVAGPGFHQSPAAEKAIFPPEITASVFDAEEYDASIHHDCLLINFGEGLVGVRLGPMLHRELSEFAEENHIILSSENPTTSAKVNQSYSEATKLGKGFTARMRNELIQKVFGEFPEFLSHQVLRGTEGEPRRREAHAEQPKRHAPIPDDPPVVLGDRGDDDFYGHPPQKAARSDDEPVPIG